MGGARELFAIGLYGGYFGAAQGVLLLAALGLAISEALQRVNALKNVLATVTNLSAALVFIVAADVDWEKSPRSSPPAPPSGAPGRCEDRPPPAAPRAEGGAASSSSAWIAAIAKLAA